MKVLVIGSDPKLHDEKSDVFSRVKKYAALFDEYYVINMTARGYTPRLSGNLHLIPTNSAVAPLRVWDAFRIARKISRRDKVDVIDAQDPAESGLAAWMAARSSRATLRIQVHTDIFSHWYRRASWKEWTRFRMAKFLIPRADCLRVVSGRIKRSVLQATSYKPQAIRVLPIFTDVSKFLSAAPDPATEERFRSYDFKMIAVGRFVDKEKNFSMLIDVMRDFVKICPKALLAIVGYGPDKNKYMSLVSKYHLEKNVIIGSEGEVKKQLFTSTERTNYIERSEDIIEPWRDDLPSFYKSFDLYVMPSNYEGWGRAVIEAMAAGIPVVMTDVGLAGEVLKNNENGIVVPVADRKATLKTVTGLFKSPKERKRLAEAGLESVRNLEPKTKEEYLRRYKDSFSNC